MHLSRLKWLIAPLTLLLGLTLVLSACGAGSSSSSKGSLTVGSKKDADGELLGEMYTLLLQKHGYTVTTKLGLQSSDIAHNAITSKQIDLYPEFTGTGLGYINQKGTSDPQKAYQEVSAGFESQFKITWLDPAYNLNDDYGLCTSQAVSQKYNLKKLSDLTAVASQLVLITPSDAYSNADVVPALESTYSLQFKKTTQVNDVSLGFPAVSQGQADVNICYTTDPSIVTNNFVLLQDDKNAFPVYNPAPIVRDDVLAKYPDIKDILNPLAAKLTTENITAAIKQYQVDKQPVDVVATNFLKAQGLL